MEEQLHQQQLLWLNDEAAALDTRIEAAVGKIEAARAEADKEGVRLYNKIYDDLVAREKDLSVRRARLEVQVARQWEGRLPPFISAPHEPPAAACGQDAGRASGSSPSRKVPRLTTAAAAAAAAAPPDQQLHPTTSSGPAPCSDLVELNVWARCSPPAAPRWRGPSHRACWLP